MTAVSSSTFCLPASLVVIVFSESVVSDVFARCVHGTASVHCGANPEGRAAEQLHDTSIAVECSYDVYRERGMLCVGRRAIHFVLFKSRFCAQSHLTTNSATWITAGNRTASRGRETTS